MRKMDFFRLERNERDRMNEAMENRKIDADDIVSVVFFEQSQCYEVWYRLPKPYDPTDTGPG